jgi:hypothetical protein
LLQERATGLFDWGHFVYLLDLLVMPVAICRNKNEYAIMWLSVAVSLFRIVAFSTHPIFRFFTHWKQHIPGIMHFELCTYYQVGF